VTKLFGAFAAVKDVTLRVEAGEFLTLLGPSGCGKTTLLRLIAGFEAPTAGSIWLGNEDVTGLPPYRRPVNQVFQSYALFPHLTVAENVGFGLRMQQVPRSEAAERVRAALELVSLTGLDARRPQQLSGGQKQRVALARALVCRPRVLLLDEPLSALDARMRHAMQLELKRLQRQLGVTFVFVTHDQEEALTMSDRIAIVSGGRIEQLGSAQEIYHRPATAFAAEFIGQAAEDFAEGQRIRAEGGTYRDAIGQCYPAGIPMLQTRVWPLMMVQLPTVIYSVSNFNNGFRQIFLDGRDYSDPDLVIYTYNGESLGRWEGDTLVVDTRYVETWNHFIDTGIPISEEFRIQERMQLLEDGRVLQIEHIMTDPNGWIGEWRSTKRWLRVDNTDIGEVECLPDLNDNIPSVQAGRIGLDNE